MWAGKLTRWHSPNICICAHICIFAYICKYLYLCKYLHIYMCVRESWHGGTPRGSKCRCLGEPGHSLPQDLSLYLYSGFVFVSVFCICLCICILYLSLNLYSVFVFVSLYFHLKMPFNMLLHSICTPRQTFWSVIWSLPLRSKLSLFKRNHCNGLLDFHTHWISLQCKLRICHTWKGKAAPFCHFRS